MFCKRCGSILIPKKGSEKVVCKCGYVNKGSTSLKEKIEQTASNIEVVKNETDLLPTTEVSCSKCGSTEAYYWTVQTRAAA